MTRYVHRVTVGLTDGERANLRRRAHTHRVTVAAYMRAAALGHRPGADPATAPASADDWWDSLPATRRAQVWQWVAAARGNGDPHPGQLALDADPATVPTP